MNCADASRAAALERMGGATLDLLVIGGGIVGASVARDAAMRGLHVGLVDRYDFAFGTSSRSSRLLHGGLRYLAQGRIGLVREASLEKRTLHKIAPHLAQPLAFLFPSFRGSGWPLWQLRIGVKAYDWLCGGKNLGRSSTLRRDAVLGDVPMMRSEGLVGAARYYDALTSDARLVLDTLRSARANGALVANYARFTQAGRSGDGWLVRIADELGQGEIPVTTRAVVNATGPWADGLSHSKVRLRLTKGIHLVLDRQRLPVPDAVVVTEGKRLLFVIPWGERVIVGTTDTDYEGDPARPTCDEADIRYLLASANETFPRAQLKPDDVIRAWVGLRPLIADPNGRPSDISRSHQIGHPESGWWDVAGGKLTTCRLMAEQAVDQVVRELAVNARPCATAQVPLLPDPDDRSGSGILPPPVDREVVEHLCGHEWAVHLDDVMIRRTSWHYYHRDAAGIARRVLAWMAPVLGWSESERLSEWQRYVEAGGAWFPIVER